MALCLPWLQDEPERVSGSYTGRTGLSLDMQNISVIADRSCCARVYSASYNMATGVFARVDLVYPVLASHESYKKKGGQRYRHFHHASQTPGKKVEETEKRSLLARKAGESIYYFGNDPRQARLKIWVKGHGRC